MTGMTDLNDRFINEIVLHKMGQQQIEPDEGWFDEDGMLVVERLPNHLQGPVRQMLENAQLLSISLQIAVIRETEGD